jgi:hypothetical protein
MKFLEKQFGKKWNGFSRLMTGIFEDDDEISCSKKRTIYFPS